MQTRLLATASLILFAAAAHAQTAPAADTPAGMSVTTEAAPVVAATTDATTGASVPPPTGTETITTITAPAPDAASPVVNTPPAGAPLASSPPISPPGATPIPTVPVDATLKDGTKIEFAPDGTVTILNADGTRTPPPDGILTLRDGTTFDVKAGKRQSE